MTKIKVLIIEDELIIAKDISIVLEQEGYETRIGVTTVPEAIEVIAVEKFDLVLIDISLRQNSNGIDLGQFLLKKDTIPYIYITSHSDNSTLDKIKDSRPHGIIIKPFKASDIKSTVAIVLNNYKLRNIDVLRTEMELVDKVPFVLKNAIQFILENLNEKIEIRQLSVSTDWSHQHFIKTFHKYIGCTPYQYILQKKIEKAKILMVETDMPLNSIATDFGFDSYSNFFKAFKKETGYTPDHFRKLHTMAKYIK